jgi:DNA-binding LacI/PurR family transcriptional regulator
MNIRETAKRGRVSHSTVSRVINQLDSVDPNLVRRQLRIQDALRSARIHLRAGRMISASHPLTIDSIAEH